MMKEKFLAALLAVVLTVLALPIGSVATVEPPIDVSRNTATAQDATDYRSFYVTDGLVLLLDAMSEEAIEATLSTETGHWYSALAGSSRYARLENGALTKNGWSVRTLFGRTCGVGYDQTVSEAHLGRTDGLKNESTPGLDLGYDNLPEGDYTLEMVINPYGVSNDSLTERVSYEGELGLCHALSLGPLKALSYPAVQVDAAKTYDLLWRYTDGAGEDGGLSLSGTSVFNRAYPDGDVDLSSRTSVIGVTLTHDADEGKSASRRTPTYTFYVDGTFRQSTTLPTGSYLSKTDVDAAWRGFWLMYNYPSILYSIRVYDRVLSSEEKSINHFADLAGYYGLDTTAFERISPAYRTLVLSRLGTAFLMTGFAKTEKTYESMREAAQTLFDETVADFVDFEDDYTPLYVKEGLAILLTAFGEQNPTVTLEDVGRTHVLSASDYYPYAAWYDLVNNRPIKLLGGASLWQYGEGGGIGFRLSEGSLGSGIDFGIESLPTEDYTFDAFLRPVGYTDEEGTRILQQDLYGPNRDRSSVFGPLKTFVFPTAENVDKGFGTAYSNNGTRWFYSGGTLAYSDPVTFPKPSGEGSYSGSSLFQIDTEYTMADARPMQFTLTHDYTASGNTSSYRTYRDGLQKVAFDTPYVSANYRIDRIPLSSDMEFSFMRSFPADFYAIRVYADVLSEAERRQNRFVDLAAYYGLDVSAYYALQETDRPSAMSALAEAFASVTPSAAFGTDAFFSEAKTAQALLDTTLSPFSLSEELYVTEGLVFRTTAYAANTTELDLSSGRWYSSVGSYCATLTGGVAAWEKKNGLACSYGFFETHLPLGISLPTALLSSPTYTVEIASDVTGYRGHAGERVTDACVTDLSVDYTAAFGSLKMKGWATPNDTSAMTYPTEWYYASGKATADAASARFELKTLSLSPEGEGLRTFSLERKTESGTERYTIREGGALLDTFSAPSDSSSENEFVLFQGMPATVYAIRVYDRALTETERQKNHFADLVYYYGLRIDGLKELASPNSVYAAMYEYGFDMTREEAQATLEFVLGDCTRAAALAVSFRSIEPRLDGDYPGVRSVYNVNTRMISLLETKYKVAYGAVAAIGDCKSGDGVRVLQSTDSLGVVGSITDGYAPTGNYASAVTVYATDAPSYATGKHLAGGDAFAYTAVLNENTSVRRYHEDIGLVFSAFLALSDRQSGEEHVRMNSAANTVFGREDGRYGDATSVLEVAYHYVQHYEGENQMAYAFNSNEGLRDVLKKCGYEEESIRTVEDEASLLSGIKQTLAERYALYASAPVLVAGRDTAPTDGSEAIWIEYLPARDPYKGSSDPSKRAIKAVYIYYPFYDDPTTYSENQLSALGIVRTFAYLGLPVGASADAPATGIVCVHGGGGHAYADYCLTAVRNGYAAIAFDTEGYHATVSRTDANEQDPLGHIGKDGWKNERKDAEEQFMFYAVADAILSGSVLRSLPEVDRDAVGITGLSWGGVISTIATLYDERLAFSVPVYISAGIVNGKNVAAFGVLSDFSRDVWMSDELVARCRVPMLILNSEKDPWADIGCTSYAYERLSAYNNNVYLVIKPGLAHSQDSGAVPAEIYRFGKWVTGGYDTKYSFPSTDTVVKAALGSHYTLRLALPETLSELKVKLYYTTAPISYSSLTLQQTFLEKELSFISSGTDEAGRAVYTVTVEVPETAYLYFLSYEAYSATDAAISVPYRDPFRASIFGSSDVVVMKGTAVTS